MISVVVTLCHLVTLDPHSAPLRTCFERVAGKIEMNINACGLLLAGVVDWKEKSPYAGDEYVIGAIRCESGNYQPAEDR